MEETNHCASQLLAFCADLHWPEALVYRIIVATLTLYLFIVWKRRKSLLMYQAWALFYFFMNIVLMYHDMFNVLSRNGRLVISMVFFLNNLIVIYRSWQYSEKYIPKRQMKELRKKASARRTVERTLLARATALWITLKHGGNDNKNVPSVRRELSRQLRKA